MTELISNYRQISLLPVSYNIISQCLLHQAQQQLEHSILEYKTGFRTNRLYPEQILNLKLILRQQKIYYDENIVCSFVDFNKAYDSYDNKSLLKILNDLKTLIIKRDTNQYLINS